LTAIIPLSVLFGTFHYLGLGAGIVGWTLAESESTSTAREKADGRWSTEGVKIKVREWIREGEDKAERVGRRYGWFGWEKESKEQRQERKARLESEGSASRELSVDSLKVSGDMANVAAAYLLVKVILPFFLFLLLASADLVSHLQALLPLRILVSLRLSPTLANVIVKRFKGLRERGSKLLKRDQQIKI